MIDQTAGAFPTRPVAVRQPSRLPFEGRHDPPDLRLRGRLARARHRHRSSRPTSTSAQVLLRHRPGDPDPRLGDGRGRRRRGWPARWPASVAWRSSTSRASRPATTTRTRSSSGSPTAPDGDVQDLPRPRSTAQPIREELDRPPDRRRSTRPGSQGRGGGDAGRRPPVRAVLRASTARTSSSSRRQVSAPATSRPSTTRCRSPSSPASCRSRSRSATRPTPRPPSR